MFLVIAVEFGTVGLDFTTVLIGVISHKETVGAPDMVNDLSLEQT